MSLSILGKIENKEHIYDYFIDYKETDAGGIVYHANYVSIAEKARGAFYRLINSKHKKEVFFVVKKMFVDYSAPAKFDQCIQVRSQIASVGNVKLIFVQKFFYQNTLLCSLKVELASIDEANLKLKKISSNYQEELLKYCVS